MSLSEGKIMTMTGISLGVDRYGKFGLCCTELHPVLENLSQTSECKLPCRSMYGYGGRKHYIKISLGFSKNDEAYKQKINATKNQKVKVDVAQEHYDTTKFGKGIYLTLLDIPTEAN